MNLTNHIQNLKSNPPYIHILLLFAFSLSFYIRAILPYDMVFNHGIVVFAADDAVYHMRMVENLIQNFPHKIWWEVYTYYPYGQSLHFGPLWTYMIACTALIFGLGSPSLELTRTIGAFYPAVFGSLLILPVYVIAKEVFDKRVGVLSAFMVGLMPGQLLQRSTLGFVDHHIGEVFFNALFLMFIILAIKSTNKEKIGLYSVLAGVSFGLYMLIWSSGVFFGGVMTLILIVLFILNHMHNHSNEKLSIIGQLCFFISALIVISFVDPSNEFSEARYSYLHLLVTLGSVLVFWLLYKLSEYYKTKQINNIYYPITIVGLMFVCLIIIKTAFKPIYHKITMGFGIFQPLQGGGLTIAEAQPSGLVPGRIFGFMPYPENFGSFPGVINMLSPYNLALLAILVVCSIIILKFFNSDSQPKILFLFWSIVIFGLTMAQNRWFYYYSVEVAILTSFLLVWIFDVAGFTKSDILNLYSANKYKSIAIILIITFIMFVAILPNLNVSTRSTKYGPLSSDYFEWVDAMTWMKYNTPSTGVDFNAVYDETFEYPDKAYGVLSWWDYGHIITYYAERIPHANPFQTGIGGGPYHLPGASPYFVAQSEDEANEVLYGIGINGKLGARYIVTNAYMTYAITDVMAIWNDEYQYDYKAPSVINGKQQWIYQLRWFTSMVNRLHMFDANGLQHYRLVYESYANPYAKGGSDELFAKTVYNQVYGGQVDVVNTGYVKIFEFVEGARIIGNADNGTEVKLYNTMITNYGRTYNYEQVTIADNGTYEFIVPYSTSDPINGQTNFAVRPMNEYTITAGNNTYQIHVNELDVLNGNIITVN